MEHHAAFSHFYCILETRLDTLNLQTQPPAQLLHHFSVALPLANQTVDDAPPLLSTPHYALPLVTQQSQLQVELVSAEGRGDVISRKTFISTKTNGFTSLVMFIYLVL